jgi:hypothetical protein
MLRVRASVIAGLIAALALAPATASAKDRYKAKGHHKAGPALFRVTFSGEGGWQSTIKSDTTHSNLHDVYSMADESSFKWSWAQKTDLLGLPWPCKTAGVNLCSKFIGDGLLPVGRQSLSYKVDDSYVDDVNPPTTANCSDSLDLSSARDGDQLEPPGITIKGVNNGSALVFSIDSGSMQPFANDDDPGRWISGARCRALNGYGLWIPGGDGSFETRTDDDFFTYRSVPVPIHTLVTAQSLVIGASGPRIGAGPAPNCGIAAGDGTTCTQSGSWSGKILLQRVAR